MGYSPRGRKELDTTERLHLLVALISLSGFWSTCNYKSEGK